MEKLVLWIKGDGPCGLEACRQAGARSAMVICELTGVRQTQVLAELERGDAAQWFAEAAGAAVRPFIGYPNGTLLLYREPSQRDWRVPR